MGFNTALTGIKASADYLSVTGNNIANSDTTGFKKSRVEFGDVYNSNVIGAGSSNVIGSGVSVNNIAQDFSSIGITDTGNNLDLAIDGTGFFVLNAGGNQIYSRAGDFKLNSDGNLVTNDGAYVQGYNAVNGIVGGSLENLVVPTDRIPPQASSEVNINLSLDSRLEDMPSYISQSFDPSDPDTYTYPQTQNVTDSGGDVHSVTLYYAKAEAPNTYQVYATVDGDVLDDTGAPWLGDQFVTFDEESGGFAPLYSGTTEPVVGDIGTLGTFTINGTDADGDTVSLTVDPNIAGDVTTPDSYARKTFDPDDLETFSYSNTNTVYDALGERHTIGYYFIKQGEENVWELKVTIDGEVNHPTNTDPLTGDPLPFLPEDTTVVFDAQGNYTGTFTGYAPFAVASPTDLSITGWDPTDPFAELAINFDERSAQYAPNTTTDSNASSDKFEQDGFAAGELQGVSFNEDGLLIASYTNQQTATLGQVALATFDNVDGLSPAGDTSWVASSESGAANIGKPNTGTFGSIRGGALEDSNVDITEELVALIEAQRNYQANSKTLETENTVTQTIINLR